MLEKIFSIKNDQYCHKVLTILGLQFKFKNHKKYVRQMNKQIKALENLTRLQIKRITPAARLKAFEVHLVEHCNLNCKGCGHFSNIAEKEFLDLETFKKDMKRMYELTNGDVQFIELLGGEPLLHPQCAEFCKEARKIFNNETVIRLVTNGLLLHKQTDEFYKTLAKYNILISPTKYPIHIDWEPIIKRCEKFGTPIKFYQGTGEHLKIMFKNCLDLNGTQDPQENMLKCRLGGSDYHYLAGGGKLFPCWNPAYIRHFNKFFHKNLEVTNRDYIDIYKAKNLDEVLAFMAKPIPFCKYCYLSHKPILYHWDSTKKDINEWAETVIKEKNDEI